MEECVLDQSIDLLFADPPYNIGKQYDSFLDRWESDEAYADWCYQWLALGLRKLKPTGSLYVMSSTQAMPYLDLFLRKQSTVLARIVWHYDSSGVQAKRKFGSMYEPILHCVMNPNQYTFNADAVRVDAPTGSVRRLIDYRKSPPVPYNSSKVPGNVWEFPRVRYRMNEYEHHPTQKPEALLERMLLASSHPGDCILDLFSGTFTAMPSPNAWDVDRSESNNRANTSKLACEGFRSAKPSKENSSFRSKNLTSEKIRVCLSREPFGEA